MIASIGSAPTRLGSGQFFLEKEDILSWYIKLINNEGNFNAIDAISIAYCQII